MDVEVELAWGIIDGKMNKEKVRNACEKARTQLDDIFCLLERYKIPVTWGFLGHVMLDRCERRLGVPHIEMPRPSYKWMKRDWYEHDPCKKLAEEPAFYGRDITNKIIDYVSKSRNPHDIACHSFSHQLFGDQGCSKEVAEAEVKRCIELMEENYGIKPKVFIFPRDYPGHLDVLKRNGFIAFRGQRHHTLAHSQSGRGVWNSIRKYIYFGSKYLSFYLTMPSPIVSVRKEYGLVNVPASMCYNKKPFIPLQLIILNAKKGIEEAIRKKKLFHLYTHLINFGLAPDAKQFLGGFEQILRYAEVHKMRNELEITTLRKIAEILVGHSF